MRRLGPGLMYCELCDKRLSTNAFAIASHRRSVGHIEAKAAALAKLPDAPRAVQEAFAKAVKS